MAEGRDCRVGHPRRLLLAAGASTPLWCGPSSRWPPRRSPRMSVDGGLTWDEPATALALVARGLETIPPQADLSRALRGPRRPRFVAGARAGRRPARARAARGPGRFGAAAAGRPAGGAAPAESARRGRPGLRRPGRAGAGGLRAGDGRWPPVRAAAGGAGASVHRGDGHLRRPRRGPGAGADVATLAATFRAGGGGGGRGGRGPGADGPPADRAGPAAGGCRRGAAHDCRGCRPAARA